MFVVQYQIYKIRLILQDIRGLIQDYFKTGVYKKDNSKVLKSEMEKRNNNANNI